MVKHKRDDKRRWFYLSAVLFIVIGLIGFYILFKPAKVMVVEEQLQAIQSGDIDKAYSYVSEEFKDRTSKRNFTRFIENYPTLKENKGLSQLSKSINENNGTIKARLETDTGNPIIIEYDLIKEDNLWKILAIHVSPMEDSKKKVNNIPTKSLFEMKNFENDESRYSIKYPTSWEFTRVSKGTVIFNGRPGTRSYFSSINIQTVLAKQTGGEFASVRSFMRDMEKQARQQTMDTRLKDKGAIVLIEPDGSKVNGEYLIFTYTYKGEKFKQWQIVVLRNDKQVFYAWAFVAPEEFYEKDLPVAKRMLDSWIIY